MRTKRPTDWHAHFTGSFPPDFLLQHAQLVDEKDLLLSELSTFLPGSNPAITTIASSYHLADDHAIALLDQALDAAFSSGGKKGFDAFTNIYAAIQRSHLAASTGHESYAYHYAAYKEILSSNIRAGVSRVLLFTSFDENMDLLKTKLLAALEAQSRCTDIEVKIRLTLPREAERVRRFASGGAFSTLLPVLKSQRGFRKLIAGIDFSGFESMDDWNTSSWLIREAVHFTNQHELGLSVHIGEDLYYVSAEELLKRFETLHKLGVKWLCHGSFLWIDERLLRSNQFTTGAAGAERERIALRRHFGAQKTIIDICPSASLAMQVIQNAGQIPVATLQEDGFRVRIGTDNPTLFRTNLRHQYDLLRVSY